MNLYIPLCFLLIEKTWESLVDNNVLYIPLCFLLIHSGIFSGSGISTSLHSTMFPINQGILVSLISFLYFLYIPLCFLLIRLSFSSQPNPASLYIPLCFLLIFLMNFKVKWRVTLYIPLCFLLILNVDRVELDRWTFTFHYVSY